MTGARPRDRIQITWLMTTGTAAFALMSPSTTEADLDRHTAVFGEAVEALFG